MQSNGNGPLPFYDAAGRPMLRRSQPPNAQPDPPPPPTTPVQFRVIVFDDVDPPVYGLAWFNPETGWAIAFDGALGPIQSRSPQFLRSSFQALGWVEVDGEGNVIAEGMPEVEIPDSASGNAEI